MLKMRGFLIGMFVLGAVWHVQAYCPGTVLAPLSIILEHAVWRGWHQAIIYSPEIEPGCARPLMKLVKCLSVNGVAAAVNTQSNYPLWSRLGIVIIAPRIKPNATNSLTTIMKQLEELEMNTASYDLLIAVRSENDFKDINEILNATSIRFDQNIVVTFPFYKFRPDTRSLGLCDRNFFYKRNKVRNEVSSRRDPYYYNRRRYVYNASCKYERTLNCVKTEYERNYFKTSERFRNLTRTKTYKRSGKILPLFRSGINSYNYTKTFAMTNISKFSLKQQIAKWSKLNRFYGFSQGAYLIQYFKVHANSTLYAYFLGSWTREHSMSQVEPLYPTEARNFLGEELTVGRCNSSGDGAVSGEDDGPAAPSSLDDVLDFLTVRLNTTSVTRYYGKLGFRSYEGVWTGLLGALMDHSVDLALEPVTAHPPRHQDLDFIFPIAETMCNIYIRHQETSTVRDIFLAPFSTRLIICVVAVVVVAALAIVLISRLSPALGSGDRPMGYTEALIWSTGILCQQGGTWTPPNPAASLLLIVCLFFAVVTYNAYAAFITSVLSVRVASLDTVAAVLHSPDFKIGYIRNGADQMYLMSTKDAQLNAFYIRGYSDAENLVSSAEEGLARAAQQDYAFFAGQRAARTTLRSLSQARGRCAVRELPVPSTKAHLAFPLPRRSPYARPILVGLLQLRSGGALDRLEAALVPSMPQCAPPPGFASARATDVRAALILLLLGLIAAVVLGLAEYCWKNRRELHNYSINCWRRLVSLLSKW